MISNMDLIRENLSYHGNISESEIIKSIIKDSKDSKERSEMLQGVRYFNGDHDVLKKDFRQKYVYEEDEEGNSSVSLIENKNNSNYHNVHNFYELLVNQKVGYIIGKAPTTTVEGAQDNKDLEDFETLVTAKTSDEDFNITLASYIEGASNKGKEWLHPYYDKKGNLKFAISPAENIRAFYDASNEKELTDIIKYYEISVSNKGGEKKRLRAEWWTPYKVSYYTEDDRGNFVLDLRVPHWYDVTKRDGSESSRKPMSWGRVPFIPLFNNERKRNDLLSIKGLIDAYNIISSTTTNDEIDLVALYWLISGYGAESAKSIASRLSINHGVSISDSNGKVDGKQVKLEVTDRIAWLKMLRKDIFGIGMGIDLDDENISSATSGKALSYRYSLLDLKSEPLIKRLKAALKEIAWYITTDINIKNNTSYDYTLIRFDINKTRIVDDSDMIQRINDSRGLVPDKILLAKHPLVEDAAQAYDDLIAQRKQEREEELEFEIKRMKSYAGDDGTNPPGDDE